MDLFKKHLSSIIAISLIIFIIITVVEYRQKKNNEAGNVGNDKMVTQNDLSIPEIGEAANQDVRPIDSSDHYLGELGAPVQLIIYDDFECIFCANFSKNISVLQKEYGDDILIAVRHFPLRSHPYAVIAALSAECAAEQDKFWPMHDMLFAATLNLKLSQEQIIQDARELELDMNQFNKCVDTEKYKDKIQKQLDEAKRFGVTGTPGLFINGESYAGAVPLDDYSDALGVKQEGLRRIIDRHLNR